MVTELIPSARTQCIMERHRHYHLLPRKSKGSGEIEAKQVKDQLPFSASVPSRSPHAPPLTATVRHSRVQNANTRSQLSGSQSSSDQNRQHAFRAFQCCLESHGIARSMSRPSNPWDNALAESFFKPLILRRRIEATALRIIKTPDDNSKGRVEPEDGPSPLSGIVPLGRIPNGTTLRKRRAAT